jgi:antitoxin VapB
MNIRIFEDAMPLYIKDDATAALVGELARQRGITKQDAVRQAVQAELDRMKEAIPLRERLEAFWRDNPLPPATGHKADKAFFDELSGDL